MRHVLTVFFVILLSGCASSSHIIIGNTRPKVPVSSVKLYVSEPKRFEVIALVRGESVTGWTQQQDTNNAIQKLKKEAADLGANGVLLSNVAEGSTSNLGTAFNSSGSTSTYVSGYSSKAEISGKAIFVIEE